MSEELKRSVAGMRYALDLVSVLNPTKGPCMFKYPQGANSELTEKVRAAESAGLIRFNSKRLWEVVR